MIGLIDCRSQGHGQPWAGIQHEMLEFFDRPLLQHAVEQMVQAGVTHCVLITEDTSAVMRRWGTGERWGCTFSAIPPAAITSLLIGLGSNNLMVGRGDCIPCVQGASLQMESVGQTQLVFREIQAGALKERAFMGWAITQPQVLLEQCFATFGPEGLLAVRNTKAIHIHLCMTSDSPKAFLRSQELVLDASESTPFFHGMQIRPNVWAARNVIMHARTRTIGKVYLGENVRIGPNVTLVGPVVVCRDSAIDTNSILADACIQPGIYVGRGMALQHNIVLLDSIIGTGQGIATHVEDRTKLAGTAMGAWQYLKDIVGRPHRASA
jgi:serine acetyltransferase